MSDTPIEKFVDDKVEKYLAPAIDICNKLSFMPNMGNDGIPIKASLNKSYHNYILHAIWNVSALPLWAKRLYVLTCFISFPFQILLTIIDIIVGCIMTVFNIIGMICLGCLMLIIFGINTLYKIWTNHDDEPCNLKGNP